MNATYDVVIVGAGSAGLAVNGPVDGPGAITVAGGGAEATVALESEWLEWSKAQKTPGQVLAVSQAMPGGLSTPLAVMMPDTPVPWPDSSRASGPSVALFSPQPPFIEKQC